MRFIQGIRVRNFRSLAFLSLDEVDNIVPIIGPNGSGKSNLLRALNLFFNNEVESGLPLDLGRDFHDPELRSKSKKLVDVELDLYFGTGLRVDLQQPIEKFADGSSTVTIRKRWFYEKATREPTMELFFGAVGADPAPVGAEDRAVVERLLNSIRFRYISNHVHPTDLLRDEEENIRKDPFRRLGKSPS